jgi:hypothetical protein
VLACGRSRGAAESGGGAAVAEHRPDLVLVTPLVEPVRRSRSSCVPARALGVRTGLCVYSWDNLTNKGLIHDPLDVVTVWNHAMQDEGGDAARCASRARDRDRCAGLRSLVHAGRPRRRARRSARASVSMRRPYLLYLCSSKFIAAARAALRSPLDSERSAQSSARLRDVGVLDPAASAERGRRGGSPISAIWRTSPCGRARRQSGGRRFTRRVLRFDLTTAPRWSA